MVSMLSNVIPLIVCTWVLCGTLLPYVLYLVAFKKFRVTSEALLIWRFNPLKPIVLPWSSIQYVAPGFGQSYKIMGSDGKQKAYFTTRMERFDDFVVELRRRRITIEEKLQGTPPLASLLNEEHRTDNEELLSSERKLRTIRYYGIILFGSLGLLLLSVILLSVGISIVRTSTIFAIVLQFPIGIICCGMGIVLLESSLNGFIRISADGIDFTKNFFGRHFVPWSELRYARIVASTVQTVRFYQKGHPDYVGEVQSISEAYLPVLQEVTSHHIPLLKETEQLQLSTLNLYTVAKNEH